MSISQSITFGKEMFDSVNEAAEELSLSPKYLVLNNSFVIVETKQGMRGIDMHALHERIIYEDLKQSQISKSPDIQKFIVPEILQLNAKEAEILRNSLLDFSSLGFEINDLGQGSFEIVGIPSTLMKLKNIVKIIEEVISDIESEKDIKIPHNERLCKYTACRSAFMFGGDIKSEEITYLLKRVGELDSNITCPHGRPIYWDVTYEDMYKYVKRT